MKRAITNNAFENDDEKAITIQQDSKVGDKRDE